ncbi:MAG: DUF6629 family protein [Solirubrobacteraceae bacterium]|nr:hypothetical protein [Patulibacter sp.]
MCFSPTADFVAAAALTPLAVATLRAAPTRRHLAIAALPAIFATHQFIEGFVWLGAQHSVSRGTFEAAIHLYLVIAQVLLPVFVPIAVMLTEPDKARRWLMAAGLGIGIASAARFGWIIFAHDVGARPEDHTMVYDTDVNIGMWATITYVIATCATTLVSSRRFVVALGVANLIGLGLAAAIRYDAVTSVWCVYAAFVSALVWLHLRSEQPSAPRPRTPLAASA